MNLRKPPSHDDIRAKLIEVSEKAIEVLKERARKGDPEAKEELQKLSKKYGIGPDA